MNFEVGVRIDEGDYGVYTESRDLISKLVRFYVEAEFVEEWIIMLRTVGIHLWLFSK